MTGNRLADFLEQMRLAGTSALGYVDGIEKAAYMSDRMRQDAVLLNVLAIGETVTRIMTGYPSFAAEHSEVPWRDIRGMRNRIAHGYFEINHEFVWDTVQKAVPALMIQLPSLLRDAHAVAAQEPENGRDHSSDPER